ncbi:hypothetical protein ILUMI_19218 [Ignelater luminosus]|uniref:Uncharacterized protein n=1 Tax=Ignelater luminosus TaxID=2038154 RepID=A0A8K0CGP2_IGNLU|nr:hypothetical protein ILUMI_19218 [Ignelater luminosus]
MQIINLDRNDYSQFAKFMGHTVKTHQQFYEITQDAYQTAKVAKLLNLFDKGKGEEYRSAALESINIDPNNELVESDDNSENGEPLLLQSTQSSKLNNNQEGGSSDGKDNEINTKVKKTSNRIRWTQQQKKLVTSYFKGHIKKKQAPKKAECENLISQNKEILSNLDWVRVKTFVYNIYTNGNKN